MLTWISGGFFERSPVLIFPVLALCIFMVVFTLGALRALLTDRRQLDVLARMPLEHDQAPVGTEGSEVEHV